MIGLILLQLIISACLTGLVWLIQLTHYPSFHYVNESKWTAFHSHHSKSISFIVMPLMLAELAMSIYWVWLTPKVYPLLCLGLVGIVWLNTFLQAVPLHAKLGDTKDESKIRKLVKVNWIRTLAWTLRTIVLGYLVYEILIPIPH